MAIWQQPGLGPNVGADFYPEPQNKIRITYLGLLKYCKSL